LLLCTGNVVVSSLRDVFICGSGKRRACAANERDALRMRIFLIPLLLAVVVILTLGVLATPPKAGAASNMSGQPMRR
jgi:hypothetical protein